MGTSQQGHMMRTLLFVCAIALLCQPGSAGPLKETIKNVAQDTWTTLAGCDEQCKDTCCRDGGGAACVSACGCSGSCPNKDFEALISLWESVASSVGSGCAKPGACGTAYHGCCFGLSIPEMHALASSLTETERWVPPAQARTRLAHVVWLTLHAVLPTSSRRSRAPVTLKRRKLLVGVVIMSSC